MSTSNDMPAKPRIRYTKGPEELGFGPHWLVRGQWCGPVDNALAGEAVYPGRVEEYGFEQEGYEPPAQAPAAPEPTSSPAVAPAVAPAAPRRNAISSTPAAITTDPAASV